MLSPEACVQAIDSVHYVSHHCCNILESGFCLSNELLVVVTSLFVRVLDVASTMMTVPSGVPHPNGLGDLVYCQVGLFLTLPGTGIFLAISGMILGE